MAILPGKPLPKFPGGSTAPAGPGTGAATPTAGVSIAANTAQKQELILSDLPGIVGFTFYSATNASGQWLRPGTAAALAAVMPYKGSIVAITVKAASAVSGTYTVHLNGAATTLFTTLSSGTEASAKKVKAEIAFSGGADLDVRATGVSGSAAVEATVFVILDPSETLN